VKLEFEDLFERITSNKHIWNPCKILIIAQDPKLIHHFLTQGALFCDADTVDRIFLIRIMVFCDHLIKRLIENCYSFKNIKIELLSVDAMMADTSKLKQGMST
jgi:hypothetical protein